MFDDLDLDDTTRASLTEHAAGLQDWMSGILEWHRRCVRYTEAELQRLRVPRTSTGFPLAPTGLGTAAVRIMSA
jgi:germacradienol/geosmin synthase